jgi:hypothetical protein
MHDVVDCSAGSAGTPADGYKLTTDELVDSIYAALQARDMLGAAAGLRVLAVQSPQDAQAILDVLEMVRGQR